MKKILFLLLLLFSQNIYANTIICKCDPYCKGKNFDLSKEQYEDSTMPKGVSVFVYDANKTGLNQAVAYWPQTYTKEYKNAEKTDLMVWTGENNPYSPNVSHMSELISFIYLFPHGGTKIWTYFPKEKKMIEMKTNNFSDYSYGYLFYYENCEEVIE
ncbi:MAG: hypothetical protein J6Y03_01910 [Alphaproteobacteria bacterium]|nr:hypothetical protein [Alphaproteobacteria bacterium]